jgi:hypothetical protein
MRNVYLSWPAPPAPEDQDPGELMEAVGLISALRAREPFLAMSGIREEDTYSRDHGADAQAAFQRERDALLWPVNVAALIASRQWLQYNSKKRKTINTKLSSYALKHIIEQDTGYICNGVCIAALLAEGYTIRREVVTIYRPSPNVWANISLSDY